MILQEKLNLMNYKGDIENINESKILELKSEIN